MKKQDKNFKVIFQELELESNQELLHLTEDIKVIVSQIENQEEALEKISDLSVDDNHIYFSTDT